MKHNENDIITKKNAASKFKWFGINFEKETIIFFMYMLLYVALLFIGGITFTRIEGPNERKTNEILGMEQEFHKKEILSILNGYFDNEETQELFLQLQKHSSGFDENPFFIKWSFTNSLLFSFTILTTIGYGRFSPSTLGGQIFLMIYGLIGIPLTAICLGRAADRILHIFKWFSHIKSDKVEKAFHALDEDGSGELDNDEFKKAMKELGVELTSDEFDEIWTLVDQDGSGTIDLDEFREIVENLNLNVTAAAAKKNESIITSIVILLWLGIGILGFTLIENWHPFKSFYFLFVSLTTIGLGDVIPDSHKGGIFLIIYGLIGLGLVALLLTVLQSRMGTIEFSQMKKFKVKRKMKNMQKKLRKIPRFASMTGNDLKKLIETSKIIKVNPKLKMFQNGDEMEKLYFLINGKILVYKNDEANEYDEILSQGSLLFESSISNDPTGCTYLADATLFSQSKVHLLEVDKNEINKLTKSDVIEIQMKDLSQETALDSNSLLSNNIEADQGKQERITNSSNTYPGSETIAVNAKDSYLIWSYGLY